MNIDTRTFTPMFIVYINGMRFGPEYEASVKNITVNERINAVSTFSISLADPMKLFADSPLLSPGAQVKVLMGYKDFVNEVITGETTGIAARYSTYDGVTTTVKCRSYLHRLDRLKRNRSFSQMSVSDVIAVYMTLTLYILEALRYKDAVLS
jgi:phage protein D